MAASCARQTVPGAGYDSYDVLLKLSAAGVVDSAFTNRVPPEVLAYRLQAAPDGDFFLLGAGFGSTLTRLHPDGTLEPRFRPASGSAVQLIIPAT